MDLHLQLSSSDSEIQGLSSLPPSPPSEPPDIRNWFSSYEYESPQSSSCDLNEFSFLQKDARIVNPECLSIHQKENEIGEDDNEEKRFLPNLNQVKDPEYIFIHQKENEIDDNEEQRFSPNLSQIPHLECIHIYQEQCSSLCDSQKENDTGEDDNQEQFLLPRKTPSLLEITGNPLKGSLDLESTCGSFEEENSMEDHDKEDGEEHHSWVSTRAGKRSRSNDENQEIRHQRRELRVPLVEKTNIVPFPVEENREIEIPGKWQCPRKNKVVRGPPMKQLRLERWVRRVV